MCNKIGISPRSSPYVFLHTCPWYDREFSIGSHWYVFLNTRHFHRFDSIARIFENGGQTSSWHKQYFDSLWVIFSHSDSFWFTLRKMKSLWGGESSFFGIVSMCILNWMIWHTCFAAPAEISFFETRPDFKGGVNWNQTCSPQSLLSFRIFWKIWQEFFGRGGSNFAWVLHGAGTKFYDFMNRYHIVDCALIRNMIVVSPSRSSLRYGALLYLMIHQSHFLRFWHQCHNTRTKTLLPGQSKPLQTQRTPRKHSRRIQMCYFYVLWSH